MIEDFDVLEMVGEGSVGVVCRATERATGQMFAIKQLRKESLIRFKQVESVRREKDVLFALRRSSPFIVELFYTFQDRSHLCMY